MSLTDSELTVQAVRLELAVHKLTNRGFDKLAEDFCSEYGVHDQFVEDEQQNSSEPNNNESNAAAVAAFALRQQQQNVANGNIG